jgi:transposase
MAIFYRPVVRDQVFLLPPDMRDWLAEDHLVWTLLEMVDRLDTSAFHAGRSRGAGRSGYDPDMLLTVLLLGYCTGVRSTRAVERACRTDVAFRIACAQDVPDHSVLARFRATHEAAFVELFARVLALAAGLGLARFGTVAIDGTKIPANASIDANRGQEWLDRQARELAEQAALIVAEAGAADDAEDALFGDARGDEVPERFAAAEARRARLDVLVSEFEASKATMATLRAKEDSAARSAARIEALRRGERCPGRDANGVDPVEAAALRLAIAQARASARVEAWLARFSPTGARPPGRPPAPVEHQRAVVAARHNLEQARAGRAAGGRAPADEPAPEQPEPVGAVAGLKGKNGKNGKKDPLPRVNTTDPQSRIQPTRKGWVQGYNAQLAVTGDQLIVACSVGQSSADDPQFLPMMGKTIEAAARLGEHIGATLLIGTVLADAGYASDANLEAEGPDRLIALGKSRDLIAIATSHPTTGDPDPNWTDRQKMTHRLTTPQGAATYKRRGATVEPGIGNLKKILPAFSRRGLAAADAELHFAAAAFNLLKIHRAQAA